MSEVLISVKDLWKTFSSKAEDLHVLQGTSFEIYKGEIVCLLGVSGSGKTTTLNIISGLDKATKGEICYSGENISSWTKDQLYEYRLNKIGFIFQDFHLAEHMTALENVMAPFLLQEKSEVEAQNISLELLKKVGLGNKAINYPDQLSTGQKQRIAVARAIAKDPIPSLLIADEPTGTLDSKTGDAVMGLIMQLVSENGMTMVYTTHDPHIAKIADRVLILQYGKVKEILVSVEKGVERFDVIYEVGGGKKK